MTHLDLEMPARPPKKRRVLEDESQTLDVWLARWAEDQDLTPSERARAQRERARRKALVPDVCVAVIVGQEGATPEQAAGIRDYLSNVQATEVLLRGRAARALRGYEGKLLLAASARDAVRNATHVVAAPKETEVPDQKEGVWDAVRFARHRGTPVTVIMPNGAQPKETK